MVVSAPNSRSSAWLAWTMQILIIVCVYSIWVVQPWYSDDWGRQWLEFSIPRAGHMFRIDVAAWYVSTVSPFSFSAVGAFDCNLSDCFGVECSCNQTSCYTWLSRTYINSWFSIFRTRRHKPQHLRRVRGAGCMAGYLAADLLSNSKH